MSNNKSKIVRLPTTLSADQEEKVIPLTAKAKKTSDRKWGGAVMKMGFCIVPSLLLRGQPRVGLNPTQLAVLLQLCDLWWDPGRKPYPSKAKIAARLGIGPRQVQRYIAELETVGLVKRIERRATNQGKLSNTYDLSGLVKKLREIQPSFRKAEEDARKSRADAQRRGFRTPRLAEDAA